MIEFDNGGILIEEGDDLPNLIGARDLFMDFETSSCDPKIKSLNPWKVDNCHVAGLAITVDDCKRSWYVPRWLLNLDWLADVMDASECWSNHNVKYDVHVAYNDLGLEYTGRLYDTLTQAKIIDSDQGHKGGYSLELLTLIWLGRDVSQYRRNMRPWLEDIDNNDYGLVPDDIIGEYACQDVNDARDLKRFCIERIPEQCQEVSQTEQRLTPFLVNVERRGLCINPNDVRRAMIHDMHRMVEIEAELEQLVGRSFNPTSNEDCYDVICNQYGLPVLAWTDAYDDNGKKIRGNPSFNKNAIKDYANRVDAPSDVMNLMLEYRKASTHVSLFYNSWLDLHVNGVLHPTYNQMVRSGRMSCSKPNAQQFDKIAKHLIIPRPGYSFINIDYSQIEYRLIVHYINNPTAINAWRTNPRMDYHNWIGERSRELIDFHIPRRPAKTVNFLFGFGGGKKRGIAFLATLKDLMDANMTPLEMERKATQLYYFYHKNLPELKPTTQRCTDVVKARGYIFNMHGRHSHLPYDRAHVGFSRLVQGDAADIMKERILECEDDFTRAHDCHTVAIVHDCGLFECPTEYVPIMEPYLLNKLETMTKPYRVPILAEAEHSDVSWGACK